MLDKNRYSVVFFFLIGYGLDHELEYFNYDFLFFKSLL